MKTFYKPQVSFVKNFDSIIPKADAIQSGPYITNTTTSTTVVTSVNDFKPGEMTKRNYATYSINDYDSSPTTSASINNSKITVGKGKQIGHKEIVSFKIELLQTILYIK